MKDHWEKKKRLRPTDEEAERALSNLIKDLKQKASQIDREELLNTVYVTNPESIDKLKQAEKLCREAVGGDPSVMINASTSTRRGCVRLMANSITFQNPQKLAEAIRLMGGVDIIPYANGSIELEFGIWTTVSSADKGESK